MKKFIGKEEIALLVIVAVWISTCLGVIGLSGYALIKYINS